MAIRLYDLPHVEPSRLVGFAGNRINRLSEKRSDDSALEALALPETRIMLLGNNLLLLENGSDNAPRALFSLDEVQAFEPALHEPILLGFQDETPIVALSAFIDADRLHASFTAQTYREVYMAGMVSTDILGMLAQAAALTTWHSNHQYCGRCGQKTEIRGGGIKRLCIQCNTEHFPRTDPVAIMLPIRGDKCILARGPHFAAGSYSCLAGFIEHGETIEAAVRRESFEEMGLAIGRVAYHASQPWPFPYSLMIGCHAEVLSDDFTVDYSELEAGRWFSKDEVRSMLAGTHVDGLRVPPNGAIATHLIRAWAEEGC